MNVVAVVGSDYLELPLSVAFGKIMPTIGYDVTLPKLGRDRRLVDPSGAPGETEVRAATQLTLSASLSPFHADRDFVEEHRRSSLEVSVTKVTQYLQSRAVISGP